MKSKAPFLVASTAVLTVAWPEILTIGGASPAGQDYLRLTPARHGTDGFFVAIFERRQK